MEALQKVRFPRPFNHSARLQKCTLQNPPTRKRSFREIFSTCCSMTKPSSKMIIEGVADRPSPGGQLGDVIGRHINLRTTRNNARSIVVATIFMSWPKLRAVTKSPVSRDIKHQENWFFYQSWVLGRAKPIYKFRASFPGFEASFGARKARHQFRLKIVSKLNVVRHRFLQCTGIWCLWVGNICTRAARSF